MAPSAPTDIVTKPLTPELWPAFTDLIDQGGPAGRCWCVAPQIGSAYRRRAPADNRADFHDVVKTARTWVARFRHDLRGWLVPSVASGSSPSRRTVLAYASGR